MDSTTTQKNKIIRYVDTFSQNLRANRRGLSLLAPIKIELKTPKT